MGLTVGRAHPYKLRLFLGAVGTLVVSGAVAAQNAVVPGEPEIPYWIDGTGPSTVVVLHGGPGLTHDYLLPEWRSLGVDRRVIFYDQRGCGAGRTGSPVDAQALVDDLHRLIQHISPQRPVVLAGSSWGSQLAGYYTVQHPEQVAALVLSGFPARLLERPAPRQRSLPALGMRQAPRDSSTRAIDKALQYMDEVARRMEQLASTGGGFGSTPEQRERRRAVTEELAERFTETCADVRATIVETRTELPSLDGLRRAGVPVLLFADDMLAPSFEASARAPQVLEGTLIRVIAGGGHDPWFTDSALFFEVVDDFLEEVRIAGE